MATTGSSIDVGTAYGMKPLAYNKRLAEVGPGTPMGELMRRYWQPFFTSAKLTADKPRRVRLLGEDLILFRDKKGRPGLVYERCWHRGTSLYYGRIEEDGIRCCNHGWKFDVEGRCLEQPAEAGGGVERGKLRQPWYPVQERYGLVYAYMGPPEKKPVLPRWKMFEDLGPDEIVEVRPVPGYGPLPKDEEMPTLNFNWLPALEQTMDGTHVPWLHYHHSGDQFTGIKIVGADDNAVPPYGRVREIAPTMVVERSALGVRQGFPMPGVDGLKLRGGNEAFVPNHACIPNFIHMYYVVPTDDTHYLTFMLWRSKPNAEHFGINELHDGKTWWQMTEEEHQLSPGDFEAQSTIGWSAHSQEHLVAGDVAIAMLRRRLEDAIRDVEEGRDPPGVSFDPNEPARESVPYADHEREAAE